MCMISRQEEEESDIDVVNDEPDVDVEHVNGNKTLKKPADDAEVLAQQSSDSDQCE